MNFEAQVEKLSLLAANAMLNPMVEMRLEGDLHGAFDLIDIKELGERMAKHFQEEALLLARGRGGHSPEQTERAASDALFSATPEELGKAARKEGDKL